MAHESPLCSDCGARPGWHKLTCVRTTRIMEAVSRRLRHDEQAAELDSK